MRGDRRLAGEILNLDSIQQSMRVIKEYKDSVVGASAISASELARALPGGVAAPPQTASAKLATAATIAAPRRPSAKEEFLEEMRSFSEDVEAVNAVAGVSGLAKELANFTGGAGGEKEGGGGAKDVEMAAHPKRFGERKFGGAFRGVSLRPTL